MRGARQGRNRVRSSSRTRASLDIFVPRMQDRLRLPEMRREADFFHGAENKVLPGPPVGMPNHGGEGPEKPPLFRDPVPGGPAGLVVETHRAFPFPGRGAI